MLKNYFINQRFYNQILIFSMLMSNLYFSFAQALPAGGCNLGTDDAPNPSSIACILGRVITIMLYVAGAIFVAMVAYGAIKLAMASGDPKGYEGARLTWTYAIMGVGVVLGFGAIFSIVGKLFGIQFLDPNSMVSALEAGINDFFQLATQGN
jgi:hypothetical protein